MLAQKGIFLKVTILSDFTVPICTWFKLHMGNHQRNKAKDTFVQEYNYLKDDQPLTQRDMCMCMYKTPDTGLILV